MEMNLPSRQQIKDQQKIESPIEGILLRELNIINIFPTPQFEIGRYRIDLALPEDMIAIECDGKDWHSSEEQKEKDRLKDEFLRKNGWRVIRISGSDIYKWADDIAKAIIGLENQLSLRILRKPPFYEEVDESIVDGEELEDLECEEEVEQEEDNLSIGKLAPIKDIIQKRFIAVDVESTLDR